MTVDLFVCPECGQPAAITRRDTLPSTSGPLEHAHIQCVLRHWFLMPVEWLSRWPDTADQAV